MGGSRILILRIGAMGDVIATLPALATLKNGFPGSQVTWMVDRRWAPLLEGNPFLNEAIAIDGSTLGGLLTALRRLRKSRFDLVVDFQGLLKSAVLASCLRAERIFGFHWSQLREKAAALFYSHTIKATAAHVIDRNLELAAAAGAPALLRSFPLPPGRSEDQLADEPFVLASPLAGWAAKQWPLEFFSELASMLRRECDIALVVNGPAAAQPALARVRGACTHVSGVAGLIYATRRAQAVVGVDSGPLHLAAALGKPGVAIFGPTDPARNGPYGGTFEVLRSPAANTSYKRRSEIDAAMRDIRPVDVFERLKTQLVCSMGAAGAE